MSYSVGDTISLNVKFPIRSYTVGDNMLPKIEVHYELRKVNVIVKSMTQTGFYVELYNKMFLHTGFGPTQPKSYYYLDCNRSVFMPCYDTNFSNVITSTIKRDIEWDRKGYEFSFAA